MAYFGGFPAPAVRTLAKTVHVGYIMKIYSYLAFVVWSVINF